MKLDDFREGAGWLAVLARDCAASSPRSTLTASALAGGAIVLSLFALLHSPVEDGQQTADEAESGAAPIEVANAPRFRPKEPVSTGSIDRSGTQSPAALPIETRRIDSLADLVEGDTLRQGAIEAAESFSECDRVSASRLIEIGGLRLVRIDCANGFGVYLDAAAIAAGARAASAEAMPAPAAAPERGAERPPSVPPFTDAEAVQRCEDQVRSGLPYPSSLGRIAASTSVFRAGPDDTVVTFSFNTVNGLRFPLSQTAYCVFTERRLARSEIMPMPY
jgi:hypothetical protein